MKFKNANNLFVLILGLIFIVSIFLLYLFHFFNNFISLLTIISSVSSIFGFIYVFFQLIIIRDKTEITKNKLFSNIIISDTAKIINSICIIQNNIRDNKYEISILRLQLLKKDFSHLSVINKNQNNDINQINDFISNITMIINDLEAELYEKAKGSKLENVKIINNLEKMTNYLNEFESKIKYNIGEKND